MKKTLLYLVILCVLISSIYFIISKHNDNPYGVEDAGFNIKDTAAIGKIFICAFNGESVLVERTDTGWLLNKNYLAMPSMVKMILTTLYQQQALYPVTKNALQGAIKDLSTLGTKVELYNKNTGKPICKFYVGGTAPNGSGTVMMMEGGKIPYVVHIQGFVGFLTNRYSGQVKNWRDRKIFNFPYEDIKTISVKYIDKPKNSFIITKQDSLITVSGLEKSNFKPADLNMHNANVYLTYFGNVNCEGYLNGTEGMNDIIKNGARHSIIDIENLHGKTRHLEAFWIPVNKRSRNLLSANPDIPDDYDADRLYALINNNKDTVMIQQFAFKNIFRKLAEFYQKGTTPQKQ